MRYVAHKATLDAWDSLGPSGHLTTHGSRLAERTVGMTFRVLVLRIFRDHGPGYRGHREGVTFAM